MINQEIIKSIKQIIAQKFSSESSGHDYWHIVRVYNNALDIAKHEMGVNLFLVELAALLHDVADHKFGYSDADREVIITDMLALFNVERSIVEQVVYIANHISFKGGTNQHVMQTIEGQIVQDADRLDALGAIGIARTFAYGGHAGRIIYHPKDSEAEFKEQQDSISHFYEKLLLLKDKMNTKTGKTKAESRHQTMVEYLDAFYKEWEGEN